MSSSLLFLAEIFTGLCISLLVIAILRKPLALLLEDICGTPERARFWVTYTNLMLVITPLIANGLFGINADSAELNIAWCRTTANCSLIGVFVGLLMVGMQVKSAVPQKKNGAAAA